MHTSEQNLSIARNYVTESQYFTLWAVSPFSDPPHLVALVIQLGILVGACYLYQTRKQLKTEEKCHKARAQGMTPCL